MYLELYVHLFLRMSFVLINIVLRSSIKQKCSTKTKVLYSFPSPLGIIKNLGLVCNYQRRRKVSSLTSFCFFASQLQWLKLEWTFFGALVTGWNHPRVDPTRTFVRGINKAHNRPLKVYVPQSITNLTTMPIFHFLSCNKRMQWCI